MKFAPILGYLVLLGGIFYTAWVWRHEYREQERDELNRIRKSGW